MLHGRGGHDTSVMAFKAEWALIDHALLIRRGIARTTHNTLCMPRWMAAVFVACRFCANDATRIGAKKNTLNVPAWCPSAWRGGHSETGVLNQVNHYDTQL